MTVLAVMAGKKAEVLEIDGNLESMQKYVGGLIQAIYPFEDPVALVCNDEAKLLGMEYNRVLRNTNTGIPYDIIAGPFFICGIGSENFTSIPKELIEKYAVMYEVPEQFIQIGGQIFVLPKEEQEAE